MSLTVCLAASTLYYPKGGGHFWVYLNWALGFKSTGCKVIWLEKIRSGSSPTELNYYVGILRQELSVYGLDNIALWQEAKEPISSENLTGCLDIEAAAGVSDLLINQIYDLGNDILTLFRRKVLLDIDPGLLQMWHETKAIHISPHDFYFTIGEKVGAHGSRFSTSSLSWLYTPPCVSLAQWPVVKSRHDAPFTTVSHWSGIWEIEGGEAYLNDKKTAFLPFLQLPLHTADRFELAIFLGKEDQEDRTMLQNAGWQVRDSQEVVSSPAKYRGYVQQSKGEFSCAKPAYLLYQNAWISDRSLCYLASGKPVIVQHTGSSSFLPDDAGMLRFHDLKGAVRCIDKVNGDYDKHCLLARALAEEHFDARKVTAQLLEKIM